MRKALPVVAFGVLSVMVALAFFMSIATADVAHQTQDLIAGQNMDVGAVEIWNDETNIYVKFIIDEDGWMISETHVHVADSKAGLPHSAGKKTSLVPGQFDYASDHDPMVDEYMYTIPLGDWDVDDELFVAAHAVVSTADEDCDCELDCDSLPDTATISLVYGWGDGYTAENPSPSYFDPLSVDDTGLTGDYEGWCIDIGRGTGSYISAGTDYNTKVFCSYETLPDWVASILDYEVNLPMINWLLNQDLVGEPYDDDEVFTMGDMQMAIWTLIDDDSPSFLTAVTPYDQDRIDYLVDMADDHGDYYPGCGDYVAIIYVPYAYDDAGLPYVTNQIVLGMKYIPPCYNDETAWGYGPTYGEGSWSMYIEYTVLGEE